METTPKSSRLHIALFGRRNAGKSSLINAITKQDIALVSDVAGTTTDPVYKAMEIAPLGPVMFIDTAGLDDVGQLGKMRVEKSLAVLAKTDIVLLVINALWEAGQWEDDIIKHCQERNIPIIAVFNQIDQISQNDCQQKLTAFSENNPNIPVIAISAKEKQGIDTLIHLLIKTEPKDFIPETIVGDIIASGDIVILVTPIDDSAPKGRLILPQVQVLRDILDHHAQGLICQPEELAQTIAALKNPPNLVITDSQAFKEVAAVLPEEIPLTSFSILMARYKGDLALLTQGVKAVDQLKPNDKILIAEACTHHQQKDDIGTVKIPQLLTQRVGGELNFTFVNGSQYPKDLSDYKLIIHCGGCMLNRKEMLYRLSMLENYQVPIVNYGILLAELNGILKRAIQPLSV